MMTLNTQALLKWFSKLPLKKWLKQINALPQRDRIALLAGGLALLIGAEFQLVMPTHDKRVALLNSQPGLDPLQAQQDQIAMQKQQAELTRLQAELAKRTPVQSVSTDGGSPRDVFAALRQAMALQQIEVIGLKAIPADAAMKPHQADATPEPDATQDVQAAVEAASEALMGATEAAAPAAPPTPAPAQADIYKHRVELRIAGSLAGVNTVLKNFEQNQPLLRLERVRLTASELQGGHIEALLSLVLISREKTWLSM